MICRVCVPAAQHRTHTRKRVSCRRWCFACVASPKSHITQSRAYPPPVFRHHAPASSDTHGAPRATPHTTPVGDLSLLCPFCLLPLSLLCVRVPSGGKRERAQQKSKTDVGHAAEAKTQRKKDERQSGCGENPWCGCAACAPCFLCVGAPGTPRGAENCVVGPDRSRC